MTNDVTLCDNSYMHRPQTCDGYFPNSLWPISYLVYICFSPENQSFFVEKMIKCSKLTVPRWVLIGWPKIPPKFSGPICLPKPKSFGYQWKKALSVVRSLCLRLTCHCTLRVSTYVHNIYNSDTIWYVDWKWTSWYPQCSLKVSWLLSIEANFK